MNRRMFIGPTAAAVITGLSLFVTQAVLDQASGVDAPIRMAFFPPWWHALSDIALGMLLVLALEWTAARSSLPLIGLGILIVPFLPDLPDRWPVLQIFSGPLTPIVWLVIASIVAWRVWISRPQALSAVEGPGWGPAWSLPRTAIAIGVTTIIIAGAAAWRLTGTNLFPGGDEPHYLVIAQSLWRDHDLKIENNHARGDYKEYFESNLEPHYQKRGADGEIYSIHPIGMPVLMAPVYAAGGYRLVVFALILIAATAAGLAWWWTAKMLDAPAAATFAWLSIAGSAPFLFNTFTVYPEIVGALAVMIAYVAAISGGPAIVIGLACGALPWLSTKYAPMSAALLLVSLARWKNEPPTQGRSFLRNPKVWIAVSAYCLAIVSWFLFFYWIWGSPLPSAPYSSGQTTLSNILVGAPGLLFDQEYGLLAFAPVYVFAAFGLWTMWRSGAEMRRQAIEIAIVFGALLATVGAFDIWWGGNSAPARPIASGLLLLSLPIAAAFARTSPTSLWRGAQFALLAVGAGIAVTLAVAQQGSLIDNGRDGSSSLLEYWSPRWPLWNYAPSFVRATPPPLNLSARSHLDALDHFDAAARPIAIVYRSLHVSRAASPLPLLSLSVKPGQRNDPQPLRVIHNGRFSLPAGTYSISVMFGADAPQQTMPLSIQVGRMGPPLVTEQVRPSDKEWHSVLQLPADAAFVGLRGPVELERAIDSITIFPTAIVSAGARPSIPDVLATAQYGAARVMFHNVELAPEPGGFWTIGKRDGRITIAVARGKPMPHLRVHGGPAPNRATFSSGRWSQRLEMAPGQAYDVALPADDDGISTITISTESGFTPSQVDPASKDNRFLGIWIEVVANN